MRRLIVVKLGGSIISDKNVPRSFRKDVVKRIGEELKSVWPRPMIVIHGGGSFGHPVANAYGIKDGYKEPSQLKGFVETSIAMKELNNLVVTALNEVGLPVIGMSPSSFAVTRDREVETFNMDAILSAIDIGLVPVMHGDAVFDRKLRFTILSGDAIASLLARKLNAQKLIFLVDVDGVYGYDRYTNQRYLVEELTEKVHLSPRYEPSGIDVTGGMFYKVEEALAAARKGVDVYIVNGLFPERLGDVLKDRKTLCTRVKVSQAGS